MRTFNLFIIFSLLLSFSRAETSGSVFFIDSPKHKYFRAQLSHDGSPSDSMLLPEVGAAVSVLLGFAPSVTLSAAGSAKLNEILTPNPFERPRAVIMLEVAGIDDLHEIDTNNALFGKSLRTKFELGSSKADIQFQDESEVSVVSLVESLGDCTDEDITGFASWLGGSYAVDAQKPLNGVLTIPLASGADVNLHMSKKAVSEFVSSLVTLFRNMRRAMKVHGDLLQSGQGPAELVMGHFDGLKGFQEQYDADGVSKQERGLLLATLFKLFDSLQAAYNGQIVGVVLFSGTPQDSRPSLNIKFTSQPSPRWLAETKNSSNVTISAEVVLVRRTLAWVTGLVLLIATLLGIYFLLNMPLTRDTLLYSNVKLD